MLALHEYPTILFESLLGKKCLVKELEQEDIDDIFAGDTRLISLKIQSRVLVSKRAKRRLRGKMQQTKQDILNSWCETVPTIPQWIMPRWNINPEMSPQNIYLADRFEYIDI